MGRGGGWESQRDQVPKWVHHAWEEFMEFEEVHVTYFYLLLLKMSCLTMINFKVVRIMRSVAIWRSFIHPYTLHTCRNCIFFSLPFFRKFCYHVLSFIFYSHSCILKCQCSSAKKPPFIYQNKNRIVAWHILAAFKN